VAWYRDEINLLKGKLDGVSVSYEGVLSLAPSEEKMEGPGEEFYLSFLLGSEGSSYLGTGHGGKNLPPRQRRQAA
jgi:hypothetical protein